MAETIYLDNHATTRVDPRVVDAMVPCFTEYFGNAASEHAFGAAAEHVVAMARAYVASLLGAESREIVFTSGATEADNLAVKGVAEAYRERGRHIVTTAIEHKAVLDSCRRLERDGWDVTVVSVPSSGIVEVDAIADALRDDTVLVSVMLVNNEIGTVQPIGAIGAITRERGILLHTDAAQGVGRTALDVDAMNVDLLSLTAHKIYGPKGTGALFVRQRAPRAKVVAQMDGGGQERGMRSGTLDVPGIVGLGMACSLLAAEGDAENARLRGLRDRLHQKLESGIDGLRLNGDANARHPGNLNVSISDVSAADLMRRLDGIAVSSGAACSQASVEPSYVLRAIGVPDALAQSSLRFGVGRFNTESDMDRAADAVIAAVRACRRGCANAAAAPH